LKETYQRVVQKDQRRIINSGTRRRWFLSFGMGNRQSWVRFRKSWTWDSRKRVREFIDGMAEANKGQPVFG
jgi:hypothetical protein